MNWYMAKLVYRIICGSGNHTAQFDEQLRLIKANSAAEAMARAAEVGMNEEDIFVNDNNRIVQWKFINISELFKLSALVDGAEIYSSIHESENADTFEDFVHKKAKMLAENIQQNILQIY